jgi:hypothetical protein
MVGQVELNVRGRSLRTSPTSAPYLLYPPIADLGMPGHDADRSTIVFDWKYPGVRVGPTDIAIIYERSQAK